MSHSLYWQWRKVSLWSLETLVNTSWIRKFEPILKILEEQNPIFSQVFGITINADLFLPWKKNLKRIKKKKQAGDSEGNSSQLTPRTTIRSPTNELRLLKKFLICSKVKFTRKTRTYMRETYMYRLTRWANT